jgi:triphosphoribosyl-dephospho-CoA synthase
MTIDAQVERRLCKISEQGQFAMFLDILTPKPGNVHRYQDHPDTRFVHFAASITRLGHPLYQAARWGFQQATANESSSGFGELLKNSVQASMEPHGKNTLLGTILLIIPLAIASGYDIPRSTLSISSLRSNLTRLLEETTVDDAVALIRTLQIASPGGAIPKTEQWTSKPQAFDFQSPHTIDLIRREQYTLRDLQSLASTYDLVAEEYITNFSYTFETVYPQLKASLNRHPRIEDVVLVTYLWMLSHRPDSFVQRKAGPKVAEKVRKRAKKLHTKIVKAPESRWLKLIKPFDEYLRSEGSKLNPGTTADLLSGALFLALLLQDVKIIL